MALKSYVRISALLWADILVAYALFVMQNYLTDVWKLSFTHAAGILNIWGGISMILPLLFLFFVDTFMGNFAMLVISSIAYSLGIGFVTMSTPPILANSTGTCKNYDPHCIGHTQKVLFYTGMALIAVGVAGNLVSVKPFLEEQEERPDDNNDGLLELLKIPAFCLVVVLPIVASVALPYIKPWSLRFGIPAIATAAATLLFLSGSCKYDKVEPQGSPITRVCRVFVAAAYKKSKPFPDDNSLFYQDDVNQPHNGFTRTRCLRCLERAAIMLHGTNADEEKKRWRLASVTEVEDAKISVRMIPLLTTFLVCGIVSSIGNTYFLEQASHMNRRLGAWKKVPLQILLLLSQWARKGFFDSLAQRVNRTFGSPIGLACSMILSILCCITAARMEIKRLNVIRDHGLLDKPDEVIPMSVFWLLFQFFLLAGLDSFFEKSIAAFFDRESPVCMKSYLKFFTRGVSGLGFMCSMLSVYAVGKISEKGGGKNWFQATLNRSRLDRYYWVLAALSAVSLVAFVVVASCYRYNEAVDGGGADAEPGGAPIASGDVQERQCCYCCI